MMPDRHGGQLLDRAGLAAAERSQGGASAVPPAARSQAPALAAQDPAGALIPADPGAPAGARNGQAAHG